MKLACALVVLAFAAASQKPLRELSDDLRKAEHTAGLPETPSLLDSMPLSPQDLDSTVRILPLMTEPSDNDAVRLNGDSESWTARLRLRESAISKQPKHFSTRPHTRASTAHPRQEHSKNWEPAMLRQIRRIHEKSTQLRADALAKQKLAANLREAAASAADEHAQAEKHSKKAVVEDARIKQVAFKQREQAAAEMHAKDDMLHPEGPRLLKLRQQETGREKKAIRIHEHHLQAEHGKHEKPASSVRKITEAAATQENSPKDNVKVKQQEEEEEHQKRFEEEAQVLGREVAMKREAAFAKQAKDVDRREEGVSMGEGVKEKRTRGMAPWAVRNMRALKEKTEALEAKNENVAMYDPTSWSS